MPYTYRNRNTGDVYTLAERDARLDNLVNWELVEGYEVPAHVLQALVNAEAERRAIEEAAVARLEKARAKAEGQVAAATVHETSIAGEASPLVPTSVHYAPAATRIADGFTPFRKPLAHLNAEEAIEQAERDRLNPPKGTVLQRARADQRSGAVQIGDNPEEHPVGRAELEAQAAADTENPPDGGVLDEPAKRRPRKTAKPAEPAE